MSHAAIGDTAVEQKESMQRACERSREQQEDYAAGTRNKDMNTEHCGQIFMKAIMTGWILF